MENATVEMQPPSQAATGNPSENRPEDVIEPTPTVFGYQSRVERVLIQGDVSIRIAGGFPQIGKLLDASMLGLSAVMDIQMARGKIYELQGRVYRKGRFHEFTMQAVCIYSTLNGRGFKMGFKFGPMNEATTTNFAAMIA